MKIIANELPSIFFFGAARIPLEKALSKLTARKDRQPFDDSIQFEWSDPDHLPGAFLSSLEMMGITAIIVSDFKVLLSWTGRAFPSNRNLKIVCRFDETREKCDIAALILFFAGPAIELSFELSIAPDSKSHLDRFVQELTMAKVNIPIRVRVKTGDPVIPFVNYRIDDPAFHSASISKETIETIVSYYKGSHYRQRFRCALIDRYLLDRTGNILGCAEAAGFYPSNPCYGQGYLPKYKEALAKYRWNCQHPCAAHFLLTEFDSKPGERKPTSDDRPPLHPEKFLKKGCAELFHDRTLFGTALIETGLDRAGTDYEAAPYYRLLLSFLSGHFSQFLIGTVSYSSIYPGDPILLALTGFSYIWLGDYPTALFAFRRARDRAKDWYVPYFGLGLTAICENKPIWAERALEQALAREPDHQPTVLSNCYLLLRTGRRNECERQLEHCPRRVRPHPLRTIITEYLQNRHRPKIEQERGLFPLDLFFKA